MSPATRGAVVVCAGFLITAALGSLCIWVLIAAELLRPLSAGGMHGWNVRQVSVPFAVAAGSFVLSMIIGGSIQDRTGPRWPSTAGGVLVGLGMVVASMSEFRLEGTGSPAVLMILGLGFMVGGGAGMSLASVVPPAVKWSVPRHRGLIVGLVLSGFALGPAWLSPLFAAFVRTHDISVTLLVQGVALLAVIVVLSQLLADPLLGYVPPGTYSDAGISPDEGLLPWAGPSSRLMLRTGVFRALWAGSALLAAETALLAVALLVAYRALPSDRATLFLGVALAGAIGGIVAGMVHDRVGRFGLPVVFALLVGALAGAGILAAMGLAAPATLLTAASGVGCVSVTWVATMECFGMRSAGANVGLVFTGWGLGILFGGLVTAASLNGVLSGSRSPAETAALVVVSGLILGAAMVLASRVRPPVPLPGVRRDRRHDSAEGHAS